MITREQYEALMRNALVQYDRYRAMYPMEAHIVFVVSPSVMAAMQVYEARNTESLFTAYHEPRDMTLLVKLRGVDVLLVQGCGDDTLFLPAFAWGDDAREICLNSGSTLSDGDLLIDDGVHNHIGGGYEKLLMDAPHNRGIDAEGNGMVRVKNWAEIYREIRRIAAQ